MTRLRFNLSAAILSSLALILIATWVLLGVISAKSMQKESFDQKADTERRLLTTFISLLPSDLSGVAASPAVAQFVSVLAGERIFDSLVLIDARGSVLFSVPSPAAPDPRLLETLRNGPSPAVFADLNRLSRYERVAPGGTVVGAVRLTLSLTREHERLQRFQRIFLAYFVLDFLLLLGFGSFLLSRLIVVPIRKLQSATEHIAGGDLSYRVPVSGTRETVQLAQSFNSMAESLTEQRAEIVGHVASLERANDELNRAREESIRSEKMASVGLLAAGMAHEVGTPLGAIMGYAAMLRAELQSDPERAEYVQRIEEDARRIDRIVRHLLDYARPRSGEFELVDPADQIRAAHELLDAQGLFKKITVVRCVPEGLPRIRVDGHQLQQVLINLLINARDAMPHGGEIRVTAETSEFSAPPVPAGEPGVVMGRRKSDFNGAFRNPLRHGDRPVPCLKIEVRDTGEGIRPEHIDHLFDPFFTTKEPGKGTGLGLAICARIIDAFNGRITVKSTVGAGACFTLWLPVESE